MKTRAKLPVLLAVVFAVVVFAAVPTPVRAEYYYYVTVVDMNQTPIVGAAVQCYEYNPEIGLDPITTVYTNQSGVALVVSEYPVEKWEVSATGYYSRQGNGTPPATVMLYPAVESGVRLNVFSDMIYVMAYYMDGGVMCQIPDSIVHVYVDNDHLGGYPSGSYIVIPEQHRTPGNHTVLAVYEGDGFPPAQAVGGFRVEGEVGGDSGGFYSSLEKEHFVVNGSGSCSAQFVFNVPNFEGYFFRLDNLTWQNYHEWWEFETYNSFYIRLNITTDSGKALIVTKLTGGFIFWLTDTFHESVGASSEADSFNQVTLTVPSFYCYGWEYYGWNPEEFQLFVVPEGSQTKVIWIWHINGKSVAYTQVLNVALDGDAVVTLEYEYSGNGYAEGYVQDSTALPIIPYYEDFKSGVAGWLSEIISGTLGIDLGYAVQILLTIVVLFIGMVRMSMPLLGAIVFLWIMDTIYTAVTTGEVRLIGDMFLRIYEVLMAIWRTLVGIIQAIWDLITFWS